MARTKRGERRGQISIFLVLALIVLTGGTVWYVFVQDQNPFLPTVPEEVAPVHEFVVSCAQDAAQKALLQIGLSGGYATIPADALANPMGALRIGPTDDLLMPYWWYDGKSRVPTLDFIRSELESQAAREVATCIDNFTSFASQYIIEEQGELRMVVDTHEQGTTFTLSYPLAISTYDNRSRYDDDTFIYESSARIKKIHELATLIMERENQDAFIEYKTIDLMAMDPKNIPLTEIELSCTRKQWLVSDVKSRIMELLSANLPFIKFQGTDFNTQQYVPNPFGEETFEASYFNSHYVWDLGLTEPIENMKASVDFDSRNRFIFNARPSENGLMQSNVQQGMKELQFFCMQIAHFTYDLQFPVTISVHDFNDPNDPYTFSFAFLASIVQNKPARTTTGFTVVDAAPEVPSSEFCAKEDVPLSLFTFDNATRMEIDAVNITYTCGRYTCDLGSTGAVKSADSAGIERMVPYCPLAIVSGKKEGYLPTQSFTQANEDALAFLFLQPVGTFPLSLVVHPLDSPASSELLSSTDSAIITLTPISNGVAQTIVLPSDNPAPLQLLLGQEQSYSVSIRIVRDDNILGGYEGEWRIGQIDDASGMEAILHAIVQSDLSDEGQFELLTNLATHSTLVPESELILP